MNWIQKEEQVAVARFHLMLFRSIKNGPPRSIWNTSIRIKISQLSLDSSLLTYRPAPPPHPHPHPPRQMLPSSFCNCCAIIRNKTRNGFFYDYFMTIVIAIYIRRMGRLGEAKRNTRTRWCMAGRENGYRSNMKWKAKSFRTLFQSPFKLNECALSRKRNNTNV